MLLAPINEGNEFPETSERHRVGLKVEDGSREHCPIKEVGGILRSLEDQIRCWVRCEWALSNQRWRMGLASGGKVSEMGRGIRECLGPKRGLRNGDLAQLSSQPQGPHLLLKSINWTQRP